MPLSELLDELFRLYRRHFPLIIGVALLVALPGLVWTLVAGVYMLNSTSYTNLFTATGTSTVDFNSQEFSNLLGTLLLGALGGLILLPFSLGAVYRAVNGVALGCLATIGVDGRETLHGL